MAAGIYKFATINFRVIAALVICLHFCLPADAEKEKKVPQLRCWRIEQTNVLWGDCTIYACSEALKVVTKNGKWMDIARAPDWKPLVSSPANKIYCFLPIEKWGQNPLKVNTLNFASVTWIRTQEEKNIGGLRATRIVPRTSSGRRNRIGSGSYWISRDLKLPDTINFILCNNAALPQVHAVPLRVSFGNNSIGPTHSDYSVNTISASQVDLPSTFFDLPKNYKETKQLQDVMSAGLMDVMKDMTGF